MKKILLFSVAIFSIFIFACSSAQDTDFTLTIFHTNDVHGHALNISEEGSMNYAFLSNVVKNFKQTDENVLFLDAGDATQGSALSNLTEGQATIEMMNIAGYDAMAIGNHEFDWGATRAESFIAISEFPLLSANVLNGSGVNPFQSYIIKEFNNVKFAIVGLTTPETAYKTNPEGLEGYTFLDPVETMQKLMPDLQKEADIIILLAHLGNEGIYTSKDLAAKVDGIDLIIDGHDHQTLPNGIMVNNTLIAETGSYSNNLGKITLDIKDKKVVSKNASLISAQEIFANPLGEEPTVKAKLEEVNAESEAILDTIIGYTPVDLNGERETVRFNESLLGQLITDGMIYESDAQIALMNGGGIRASIAAGNVTKRDVLTVLPFGNEPTAIEATGAQVKAALEHSLSAYPEANGGFLHVSGITFTVTPTNPVGNRISNVMVGDKALEDDEKYSVILPDFLAVGGDGFDMFVDCPVLSLFSTDEDIFIHYLQNQPNFNTTFTPRITWN